MASARLRQLTQRLTALEYQHAAPQNKQLEVWSILIDYMTWLASLDNPENWNEHFRQLPTGHHIRKTYSQLLWAESAFVPCFKTIDCTWKAEKIREVFSCYVETGIDVIQNETHEPISNLKQKIYLDSCIEFCKEKLQDSNFWSEFDKELEEWHKPPPTSEKREEKEEMLVISENLQKTFDELEAKYHPPPPVKPKEQPKNNGTVDCIYQGHKANGSFEIETVSGRQRIYRGLIYSVSQNVWENLVQNEPPNWWQKVS